MREASAGADGVLQEGWFLHVAGRRYYQLRPPRVRLVGLESEVEFQLVTITIQYLDVMLFNTDVPNHHRGGLRSRDGKVSTWRGWSCDSRRCWPDCARVCSQINELKGELRVLWRKREHERMERSTYVFERHESPIHRVHEVRALGLVGPSPGFGCKGRLMSANPVFLDLCRW
jgi:hypothetical protein